MEPDLEFFQSIEWCARILSDPAFIVIPTVSRSQNENTLDQLFAVTLNTENTIRACITLVKKPTFDVACIDELHFILTLGSGVNGYPNICHGGIVAFLLDEAMAVLMRANRELEDTIIPVNSVTATMNFTILKPVKTPQTIHVIAKFREIKERKCVLEATIQDADGMALAKGEALWIGLRAVL